MLCTDEN